MVRNRILLIGLILILCTSFAYSKGEAIDSQKTMGDFFTMGNVAPMVATEFNTTKNYCFKNISVYIEKVGTPAGNINLSIYTSNSSYEPLTLLQTSNGLSYASISNVAYAWYNLTLTTPVCVNQGTFLQLVLNAGYYGGSTLYWGSQTGLTNPPYLNDYSVDNGATWVRQYGGYQGNFITYNESAYGASGILFQNPTPANNTINNTYTNVIINISSDIGDINVSWNGTQVGNGSESSTFSFELNNSLVTGTGLYTYFATNGVNNITYLWTYDNVLPTITLNAGSSFNASNVTLDRTQLKINLTFADNDLIHAYLINVTNKDTGVSYFSEVNESVDLSSINIYRDVNVIGFPIGTYKIETIAADGHTAIEIDKYDYTKPKNAIEYNTDEGNKIKISTLDSSTFATEKKKDKYSFSVSYDDKVKQKDRTIYIESDNKLIPIKNNKYQGWFASINWAEKKGNWIDLEGEGKVKKITKITDYKYEVIYEAENNMITFNSIGGLNFAYADYEWINNAGYLDNCSNPYGIPSNATALYFSFKDIVSLVPSSVNVTSLILGEVNYSNSEYQIQNYSICIYPNNKEYNNLYVQLNYYFGSSFSQWTQYLDLSNITQSFTLYTAETTQQTTFSIIDSASGLAIPDALGTMYTLLNGSFVTVQSKYSDVTGRMVFDYVTNNNYKFFISKEGYDNYIFYLNPILSSTYTIPLEPQTLSNYSYPYQDVGVAYYPYEFIQGNNNFTFLIQSPDSKLETYNFTLTYPTSSVLFTGIIPTGQQYIQNFTITNPALGDKVYLDFCFKVENYDPYCFANEFPIIINATNTTMQFYKGKTYGLGIFERILILTIISILCVGTAALVGQVIGGMILAFGVMAYLVYIAFVPLWIVLVPVTLGLFLIFLQGR